MSQKQRRFSVRSAILLTLLVGLVLVTAIGCDLFGGVSTDERVTDFMSDLAAGRWGNMRSHVHPSVEGRALMGSDYFRAAFIDTRYNEVSRSGSGSNRSVLASPVGGGSNITIVIRTRDSGRDAYINELSRDGVQIVPINSSFP